MQRLLPVIVALMLVGTGAALAHPGHPETAGWVAGLMHPFLGADHVLAMLAVASCDAPPTAPVEGETPTALVQPYLAIQPGWWPRG